MLLPRPEEHRKQAAEGLRRMLGDCYERGHTHKPDEGVCVKCGEQIFRVTVDIYRGVTTWHTQAELDRLWQGVDREASRVLGERHGG